MEKEIIEVNQWMLCEFLLWYLIVFWQCLHYIYTLKINDTTLLRNLWSEPINYVLLIPTSFLQIFTKLLFKSNLCTKRRLQTDWSFSFTCWILVQTWPMEDISKVHRVFLTLKLFCSLGFWTCDPKNKYMHYFVVFSLVNIAKEIVLAPNKNSWEFFHAPKIS
jgi:hypothetical protein